MCEAAGLIQAGLPEPAAQSQFDCHLLKDLAGMTGKLSLANTVCIWPLAYKIVGRLCEGSCQNDTVQGSGGSCCSVLHGKL